MKPDETQLAPDENPESWSQPAVMYQRIQMAVSDAHELLDGLKLAIDDYKDILDRVRQEASKGAILETDKKLLDEMRRHLLFVAYDAQKQARDRSSFIDSQVEWTTKNLGYFLDYLKGRS